VRFNLFLKVDIFAAFIERPKAKSASASRGLRPLTLLPGALPLDPLGAPP